MRCLIWVLLPIVLVSSNALGGYEFSISASATDPYVNADAAINGIRNLYLWFTCGDSGLSAFEADTEGSQDILAFTPLNGAVNAGTPNALLLGIPGCPQGSSVNHLLGYWLVNDDGGTICLGPSDESGWIAAVDCETNPVPWLDPKVRGFSSEPATSPCESGLNACTPDSIPMGAVFMEQASFSGWLPYKHAWSPVGSLLAVGTEDGLLVYDADSRSSIATRVLDSPVTYVAWSPDARWIACKVRDAVGGRERIDRIVASSVDGSNVVEIHEPSHNLGHIYWGTDGFLYCWLTGSGERQRFEPPLEWTRGPRFGSRNTQFMQVDDSVSGGIPHWVRTSVDRAPEDRPLEGFDRRRRMYFQDTFPGDHQFLVRMFDGIGSPYSAVVDSLGNAEVNFGRYSPLEGFCAKSVSHDGRLIAGHHTTDAPDGHSVLTSELYLASPDGAWKVGISNVPMGLNPQWSRARNVLAFESLDGGRVHVGTVEVLE